MATEIGTITALMGTATATSTDGSIRTLQVGDKVYANDLVTTGSAGAVEIEFVDGSIMDMGRNSQAVLDTEIFDPAAAGQETPQVAETDQDVEDIQQALLEGEDPTAVGEATAAGPGAGGGGSEGGHDFVVRDYLNPEVTPTSGFETTGPGQNFVEDPEDLNLLDGTPDASLTTVLLDEDDLVTDGELDLGDAGDQFLAFLNSELFIGSYGFESPQGVGDERTDFGDDTGSPDGYFLGGSLVAGYGLDGPSADSPIVFNVTSGSDVTDTAGNPVTSGGEQVKYWVSDDGETVIGYIANSAPNEQPPGDDFPGNDFPQFQQEFEGCEPPPEVSFAQIIFTAQLTPTAEGGDFLMGIFGQFDHELPDYENGEFAFEDNLFINLGFTITDADGDTADGILQLNADDDSPVRAGDEETGLATQNSLVYEEGLSYEDGDLSEGHPNPGSAFLLTSNESNADQSEIESFLGLTAGSLDAAAESNGGAGDAENGSAVETSFNASAGDIISFNWAFNDNDGGPYNDFAFVVINGEVVELADSNGGNLAANPFTYEVTADGEITIGFGQMNVGDSSFDSELTVSDLQSNGEPVSADFGADWDVLGSANITDGSSLVSDDASGNLNSLVNMGADGPGSFALLQPSDNPFQQAQFDAAMASLPTLSSKGEAVEYNVEVYGEGESSYSVLTATAGEGEEAREIFTLTIDGDGEWTFDLNDQLDHVAGESAEENLGMVTLDAEGEPNGSVDSIDFTQLLQIRDFDGDQVIITEDDAGMFTISIQDDIPVVGESTALVDDEGLPGGNPGIEALGDDEGQGENESTFSGQLNASVGSDEPAVFSFAAMAGEELTVGTETVTFSWNSETNTLTATGPRGALFDVEITDTESGDYTLTLLDNVLHESLDDLDGDNTENNAFADLTYTVTDEDGDTVEGVLNVNFDDDMPVATEATVSVTVDEDDIRTDLSSGNDPYDNDGDGSYTGEPITIFGYTTDFLNHFNGGGPATTTGSVASLVSFGADAEGASFSLTDNFAGLEGQGLTSKGDDLNYEVQGDTLIASADGRAVFTLELEDNGDFSFKLYDQLDHAAGEGENNLNIDLSALIRATDADEDSIVLDSGFTIDVTDDVPEEAGLFPEVGIVEEEALPGGNQEIHDIWPDTAVATGSLSGQVSGGADDDISFSFADDLNGLPTLTSNEEAVSYEVDGDTLTASSDSGEVFTLKLESNGDYTFTLKGAIDHTDGNGENLAGIDFSSIIEAKDFDGDTITLDNDFFIKIVDDVPTVIPYDTNTMRIISDDDTVNGLNGNPGGVGDSNEYNQTGTLQFSAGADGGTVAWNLDNTSVDDATAGISFSVNEDGTLILTQEQDGEPVDVAEVTLNETTGEYEYTQIANVLHTDDGNNDENEAAFTLGFTVTDGDGDQADGKLTLLIDDDTPVIDQYDVNTMRIISDDDTVDGLNGNPGGVGDSNEYNQTGTLQFSAGADGGTVAWNLDNTSVDDATAGISFSVNEDGTLILTQEQDGEPVDIAEVTLNETTGEYEYTQIANVLHTDDGNNDENEAAFTLGFTVTDGDGDQADGYLTLLIDDDTPVVTSQQINLLSESFENFAPDMSGNNWTVVGEGGGTIIGNNGIEWTVNGAGIEIQSGNVGGASASDGNVHAELDAHDSNGDGDSTLTVLSTEVDLPTTEASLSFDFQPRPSDVDGSDMAVSLGGQTVNVNVDGAGNIDFGTLPVGVSATQSSGSGGWTSITLTFTGLDTSSAQTLGFEGVGSENTLGAYIDNINLNAVSSLTVDESALADGNGEIGASTTASFDFSGFFSDEFGADGPAGEASESYSLNLNGEDVASGLFTVDNTDTDAGDGDGYGQGTEIVLNEVDGEIVGSADGNDYFTISVNDDGEVTLTQLDNVWHADTTNPDDSQGMVLDAELLSLVKTITDADGDSADAALDLGGVNFNFEDDGPVAIDDVDSITDGSADGNVVTADSTDGEAGVDSFGADGAGSVTSVTFGETTVDVPAEGSVEIDGDYGTLSLSSDGSYTYTTDPESLPQNTETVEGWTPTDGNMTAFDLGESFLNADGTFSDTGTGTVTTGGNAPGFGVEGTSAPNTNVPAQINYSGSVSEALAFKFDGNVTSATVQFSNLFQNENGGEAMRWHAFDTEGNRLDSGIVSDNEDTTDPYADNTGATFDNNNVGSFTVSDIGAFSTLVFEGVPYSDDGSANADDSDFFVNIDSYELFDTQGNDYQDEFTYTI